LRSSPSSSARIRDRVSAGKLQKKKLGRDVHGRVPYGYRSTGGILEPVEDLVPVVRRIYRDARDGWTLAGSPAPWTGTASPQPRAGRWKPQVVRSILTNPAYAGERYGVRNTHAAIISRRAWNAAQAALAARARAA
jgi:DNA invertase Pin-like site-specific DNA recombinase